MRTIVDELREYTKFPSDEEVKLEGKLLAQLHDMYNDPKIEGDEDLRHSLEMALLYGRVFVKD